MLFRSHATWFAGGVLVEWTALQETNLQKYQVETSVEGTQWHSAGNISLKPNRIYPLHYQYFVGGKTGPYFRLAMTESDGRTTYSTWRNEACATNDIGRLFPNPSNGTVNLELPESWDTEDFVVQIQDVFGKVKQQIQQGPLSAINGASFPAGIYFVVIYNERGEEIQRIKWTKI